MQLSLHLFVTNSLRAQDRACSEGALPPMVTQSKAKAQAKATANQVANGSQATLGAMPGVTRPSARSHELALTANVKKDFEDRTQIDFRLL